MVIIEMASNEKNSNITFRISLSPFMNCCQWVVGAHRAGALTLAAKQLSAISSQPSAKTFALQTVFAGAT
jgi:hypothetical protein